MRGRLTLKHALLCSVLGFAAPVWAETTDLVGDPEYGAYLASECETCHKGESSHHAIPVIRGSDQAHFIAQMNAYRASEIHHPVMEMVAARLNDEEIAALSAYFATVD